jgi:NitT/TauT family transport system ATP-binding protein
MEAKERLKVVSSVPAGNAVPATHANRIVVHCNKVSHRFGEKRILHDINLEIGRGEIVGLVGPSGCGKSTLLRAILGTHPPVEGEVVMQSSKGELMHVTGPGKDRGIVYQKYTLYPHLTAQENVMLGLTFEHTTLLDRILRRAEYGELQRKHMRWAGKLLVDFGLQDALERYPHEMSGGMCQRVAIAQALITKPRVLLMDEPFGALDPATREDLQRMLLRLYAKNLEARAAGEVPPYTVVIVTHELDEAIFVGDRVVGLSQFYDHRSLGLESHPGATIVYDDAAPIFGPEDARNHSVFAEQRADIQAIVFDKTATKIRPEKIRFWARVTAGETEGVMAT